MRRLETVTYVLHWVYTRKHVFGIAESRRVTERGSAGSNYSHLDRPLRGRSNWLGDEIVFKEPVMTDRKLSPPKGADWTQLLADPDLIAHIGSLLEVYRTAAPEKRNQALVAAMRKIKVESGTRGGQATRPPQPANIPAPPFEPDFFTQTWGDDRRRYPRMKCFVAVELRVGDSLAPVWGNLANTSLGGCLIETATPLPPGTNAEVGLWVATGKIWIKGIILNGIVTGTKPCFGIRVKFDDLDQSHRETLRHFLTYVEKTTKGYRKQNDYLSQMKR